MELFFSRVHQNTVAIDITLAVHRLSRLATVIKGNRIRPDILLTCALLLVVMPPMNTMPVKIVIDTMLETCPDGRARIGRRAIDYNCPASRPSTVVDPIITATGPFLLGA